MKILAATSAFSLYCAGLWLTTRMPEGMAAWVMKLLAAMPGLVVVLGLAGVFRLETRRPDQTVERLFTRLGWTGTAWLAVGMTVNSIGVSELSRSDAPWARVAMAVLVLLTGIFVAWVAWLRAGRGPHPA
ncbi:MAG TPA: hypothetical protein VMT18_06675 [Planctomycetota bacterium]|nr:hypothetical protein [Planctomycetota bacterium]